MANNCHPSYLDVNIYHNLIKFNYVIKLNLICYYIILNSFKYFIFLVYIYYFLVNKRGGRIDM